MGKSEEVDFIIYGLTENWCRNLSHNLLQGQIPSSVGHLESLLTMYVLKLECIRCSTLCASRHYLMQSICMEH